MKKRILLLFLTSILVTPIFGMDTMEPIPEEQELGPSSGENPDTTSVDSVAAEQLQANMTLRQQSAAETVGEKDLDAAAAANTVTAPGEERASSVITSVGSGKPTQAEDSDLVNFKKDYTEHYSFNYERSLPNYLPLTDEINSHLRHWGKFNKNDQNKITELWEDESESVKQDINNKFKDKNNKYYKDPKNLDSELQLARAKWAYGRSADDIEEYDSNKKEKEAKINNIDFSRIDKLKKPKDKEEEAIDQFSSLADIKEKLEKSNPGYKYKLIEKIDAKLETILKHNSMKSWSKNLQKIQEQEEGLSKDKSFVKLHEKRLKAEKGRTERDAKIKSIDSEANNKDSKFRKQWEKENKKTIQKIKYKYKEKINDLDLTNDERMDSDDYDQPRPFDSVEEDNQYDLLIEGQREDINKEEKEELDINFKDWLRQSSFFDKKTQKAYKESNKQNVIDRANFKKDDAEQDHTQVGGYDDWSARDKLFEGLAKQKTTYPPYIDDDGDEIGRTNPEGVFNKEHFSRDPMFTRYVYEDFENVQKDKKKYDNKTKYINDKQHLIRDVQTYKGERKKFAYEQKKDNAYSDYANNTNKKFEKWKANEKEKRFKKWKANEKEKRFKKWKADQSTESAA
ncbi:MAG: hypothetical protein ACJAZS_000145 [Alteromonas naphthalenivorans]|jgi:hypothetical protein